MAHAAPAHIATTHITVLTSQNRPEREFLGLHAMTWEIDPATGLWKQYPLNEAPIPGTTSYAAVPERVITQLPATKLDRRTIDAIYRAILRHTWAGLKNGERVLWPGYATFFAVWIPPRTGRNPRTGDSMPIPGYWRLGASVSKKTDIAIN